MVILLIGGIIMKKGKTLTLSEAMDIIKLVGFNMTKNKLRTLAKLYVLTADHNEKRRDGFLLDNDQFFDWLFSQDNIAPEGYIPVSFFARKKGISPAYVYDLIRKNIIEPKIFGGGRGKYFINAKQVQKILEKKGIIEKSLVKRTKLSYKSRYQGYEDFLMSIL